jgi:gas vesicle protein
VKQFSDESNGNGSSTGAFFTGLFAGAVIGAGLGLWFAPKAGEEMREQLTDSAKEFGQKASKTVNDLADRGREVFDRAREVMTTAGDQFTHVAGEASKAAGAMASTARRGAQNVTAAAERS